MDHTHFSSLYPLETRFEELKTLLLYVRTGGVSEIVSMQGVGRTVFLGLLAYNRTIREKHLGDEADNHHFVLVDFAELKRAKEDEVWKTLFSALLVSLEERGKKDEHARVKELFVDAVSYNDSTLLFQGLKSALDYLLLDKHITLVFLFDSFELYAPSLTSVFLERLRVFQDRYRYNFSLVFSSSHRLDQLVGHDLSETITQLISDHTMYLSIYDEVGYGFLVKFLEKHFAKNISSKMVSEVHLLTGGHAKLSKVLFEEVFAHDAVDNLREFAKTNRSVEGVNRQIWQDLFPREQLYLKSVVQGKKPIDERGEIMDSLRRLQILNNNAEFTISLLKEYVAQQSEIDDNDSFVLREDMGEILRGDDVVSDVLTKHEYKLLRYFLENSSKVLSRDDIALAAWGEEKAEVGISDQAIDQLVFRLRRKVEEDPDAPHHILTVKGRGFQFLSSHS